MAENNTRWWQTPSELWGRLRPEARRMRHCPTEAEEHLWKLLRNRSLGGIKFRRQHSIGPFIADFYSRAAKLVIEVDGEIHRYTPEEDLNRMKWLQSLDIRVIRFTNEDVLHTTDAVLQRIREGISSRLQ